MKLVYRGIAYEATAPDLDVAETDLYGKYRGVEFHSSRAVVVPNSAVVMRYRGVRHLAWK